MGAERARDLCPTRSSSATAAAAAACLLQARAVSRHIFDRYHRPLADGKKMGLRDTEQPTCCVIPSSKLLKQARVREGGFQVTQARVAEYELSAIVFDVRMYRRYIAPHTYTHSHTHASHTHTNTHVIVSPFLFFFSQYVSLPIVHCDATSRDFRNGTARRRICK